MCIRDRYDRALVASNNFLKDEDQPYRRADGMLDKASIPVSYTHLDVYKRQGGRHPHGDCPRSGSG